MVLGQLVHPGNGNTQSIGTWWRITQGSQVGYNMLKLVGGLEPWIFMTFHILGRIIPTD